MTIEELKAFRDKWNLSQRDLAPRIGYHHSTVASWELGHRRIPVRVDLLIAALERSLQDERRPQSEDQGR